MTIVVKIPQPCPSYQPGARLLAMLAYPPGSPDDRKWQAAERLICRSVLMAQQQLDPTWASKEQQLVPEHLTEPVTGFERKWSEMQRLHGYRLGAAEVAMPFLQEALRLRAGAAPAKNRATTIKAQIQRVVEREAHRVERLTALGLNVKERFPTDEHNFSKRVFRPSRPVLHLACAIAVAIDQSQKAIRTRPPHSQHTNHDHSEGYQLNIAHFILDPDLAHTIIAWAMQYEQIIPFLPASCIAPIVAMRLE